jgi:hypothetical protein
VAVSTIHSFIRVRAKHRKEDARLELVPSWSVAPVRTFSWEPP